jgi:mono/diheme cytochrome c family protein
MRADLNCIEDCLRLFGKLGTDSPPGGRFDNAGSAFGRSIDVPNIRQISHVDTAFQGILDTTFIETLHCKKVTVAVTNDRPGRDLIHANLAVRGALLLAAHLAAPAFAADPDGKAIFQDKCGACHGETGGGLPNLAPPLKGNSFVTSASAQDLQKVIKDGRVGKQKRYPDIAQGMPAQPVYDDDLDAVVKYVKSDLQK